jgi:hypothetical protein
MSKNPSSESNSEWPGKSKSSPNRAVGVYDRPERSGPSKAVIIIIAVSAIAILLIILMSLGVIGNAGVS